MARKRQTNAPARPGNRGPAGPGAGPDTPIARPNLVAIDLDAGKGRVVAVGDRMRIGGRGRYAGEQVVVERVTNGVIPSAVVRNEAGELRHVRTIDLEPAAGEG